VGKVCRADAEDHRERQREGVGADQIGPAARTAGSDAIEEIIHDGLYQRAQPVDTPPGEGSLDQAAQPGVIGARR
jgi:hypothetical protein